MENITILYSLFKCLIYIAYKENNYKENVITLSINGKQLKDLVTLLAQFQLKNKNSHKRHNLLWLEQKDLSLL